jgi:tetratricopeptide (TPR) repeat protein
MVVGTLRYLSPEQAVGETVTAASDIFSLGTMMYELLTGTHPFSQGSEVATLAAIVTREPPPPAQVRDTIPDAVDALIRATLDKEPAGRPTAADLARRLRDLAAQVDRASGGPLAGGVSPGGGRHPQTGSFAPDGAVAPEAAPSRNRVITVGREAERARLAAWYAEAARGHGQVIALSGEPGIGKSTLLATLFADLRQLAVPPLIARGQCSERLAGAEAYLPILEALDDAMHGAGGRAVRDAIERHAPTWSALLATASQPADDAPRGVGTSQERLKREMAALLAELARSRPVVLTIEDVHWADVSTVDLLSYLGDRLATAAVLFVVTYRDAELRASKHPYLQVQRDLQARGLATELPVGFLHVADVSAYLAQAYGGHRFPRDFAASLHARTEGNPLFLVDVLRWLAAQSVIAEDAGHWRLVRDLGELDRELPASVRSMIERKIEQLGGAERRLLAAAAVQGAEFDSAVAAAVLGADPIDVEEQLMVLDKVYAFVRHIGEERWPDRSMSVRYRFVHALYQNVLLAGLAPSRRAAWSATVAELLERRHGERAGELAAELAVLHETARAHDQAAAWFAVASGNAREVHAYAESEALALRGLAQVEAMPPGPAQLVQELGLRLALGVASLVRRGYAAPETADNMRRARELCAALGDSPALSSALWVLLLYNIASGHLVDAEPIAALLLRQGEQTDDVALRIAAHSCYIGLYTHMARFVEALAHRASLDALLTPERHAEVRRRFQPEPVIMSRAEQLRSLVLLGRADEARRVRDLADAEAQASGHPQDLAFVAHFIAEYELLMGSPEAAVRHCEAAAALCEEYGIASERLWALAYLGAARARCGALEEGIALMREMIGTLLAIGCPITVPGFQLFLADAEWQAGDPRRAIATIDEALTLAARTGDRAYDGTLHALASRIDGDEVRP